MPPPKKVNPLKRSPNRVMPMMAANIMRIKSTGITALKSAFEMDLAKKICALAANRPIRVIYIHCSPDGHCQKNNAPTNVMGRATIKAIRLTIVGLSCRVRSLTQMRVAAKQAAAPKEHIIPTLKV